MSSALPEPHEGATLAAKREHTHNPAKKIESIMCPTDPSCSWKPVATLNWPCELIHITDEADPTRTITCRRFYAYSACEISQSRNTRQSPRWHLLFNPCSHHLKSGDTHFHVDDDSHPCMRNVSTSWAWGILKAERIRGLSLSFVRVELGYLVASRKHHLFDDTSYDGSITQLSPRNDFQLAVFRPVSA